jgi:dUTP pyrophosphatase
LSWAAFGRLFLIEIRFRKGIFMRERGFAIVKAYSGQGISLPSRKTACSAGYDLSSAVDAILQPGQLTVLPTGIKAYMQPGEVLLIFIRSSMALRHQLALANGVGVVDADYYDNPENEGHLQLAVINRGDHPVVIKKGDRVAQGIFLPYLTVDKDAAGKGESREGGFGSTGKR